MKPGMVVAISRHNGKCDKWENCDLANIEARLSTLCQQLQVQNNSENTASMSIDPFGNNN